MRNQLERALPVALLRIYVAMRPFLILWQMRNQLEHVVFLVVNMQFRHKADGAAQRVATCCTVLQRVVLCCELCSQSSLPRVHHAAVWSLSLWWCCGMRGSGSISAGRCQEDCATLRIPLRCNMWHHIVPCCNVLHIVLCTLY